LNVIYITQTTLKEKYKQVQLVFINYNCLTRI